MTWGLRKLIPGLIAGALLVAVGAEGAGAQTIPPPLPNVDAVRRGCNAQGNVVVDVTIENPYDVPITVDAANYTSPVPVPFPGGAGGSAFTPNPVPALGSSIGTDVFVPGADPFVLVITIGIPGGTVTQPLTIVPGSCPPVTTPTTASPPVVNPRFTG